MKADKIVRSHRSSIGIRITQDGKIVVSAPHLMPNFFIERFLDEKKDWITKSLSKVQAHPKVTSRKYGEGEEFLYLGKPYKLRLGNFKEIAITHELQFPVGLQFRAQKELTNWYVRQAREKISQRVAYHSAQMQTSYKSIFFSDTSSKWGTCTPDNRLQFNWRLIMAPLMVLDYVVIHELAHTTEKNHSRDFWNIVRRYTPAYRQHREWLNKNATLLVV